MDDSRSAGAHRTRSDVDNRGPGSTEAFDATYHRWNLLHAGIVVVLVVACQFRGLTSIALPLLAAWIPIALAWLYRTAHRLHPDGAGPALPNILTGSRVLAATAILALAAVDSFVPTVGAYMVTRAALLVPIALGLVETTDFFDGQVARRMGSGRFGATWDMESDAAFTMALALGLDRFHSGGVVVLLIGLMRYVYVLVWRYDGDPAEVPATYKMFAKTVAAVIVVSLIVGYLPRLPAIARTVGFATVLALQATSFLWDLVLQRKASRAA